MFALNLMLTAIPDMYSMLQLMLTYTSPYVMCLNWVVYNFTMLKLF